MSKSDDDLRMALIAIVRECSPSALPETRAKCIAAVNERNPEKKAQNEITGWRPRWWDEYPMGNLTRLAYRVYALCQEFDIDTRGWAATWDEPGEELPPLEIRLGGKSDES